MTIFEFSNRFENEESCTKHMRETRESEGIICKNCGHERHMWLKNKKAWQCRKCGSRQTLKSGTVMENSKLPLLVWYRAIALLSSTRKSISALEIQRQLGLKRYEPVWAMCHKIRAAMGIRDGQYMLQGDMEVDEGFFKGCRHPNSYEASLVSTDELVQDEKKRGRGTEGAMPVLIMVESQEVEKPKEGKKKNKIGHIKMQVLKGQGAEDIVPILESNIVFESKITTDGYSAYSKLGEHFDQLRVAVVKEKQVLDDFFPWVHTIISNAKRLFLGFHHKIGKGYLQLYLNEFCYKFNRRFIASSLIERMIKCCITTKPKLLYTWRGCG